jgi:hypothetical protein
MDSGFFKIILFVVIILSFTCSILKIWLTPDDYSLSLPVDVVTDLFSNTEPTGDMCHASGIDVLVDSKGNRVEAEKLPCKSCPSYYELLNTGKCLTVEHSKREEACITDPLVKPITCPF